MKRSICIILTLCLFVGLFSNLSVLGAEKESKAVSDSLQETAQALIGEIDALGTGSLRNGRVKLEDSGFTIGTKGSFLKGDYYIVRKQGDDAFYALNGNWTGSEADLLPMVLIQGLSNTGDPLYIPSGAGVEPHTAFHFTPKGYNGDQGLYELTFTNGRYFTVGSQYSSGSSLYKVKGSTSAATVSLYHPTGVTWFTIRSDYSCTYGLREQDGSSTQGMRWKAKSASDSGNEGNALMLYRLWETQSIATAIKDMKAYLSMPELFDEDVFAEFLTCMRQTLNLYDQWNANPGSPLGYNNHPQDKLDAKEAELRAFANRLSSDLPQPSASQLNAATKIHQLPTACGYVIQTREGKIIVIDGGWQSNNTEGKYLFSYLQQITGDSTPHIDAWFLTHAHADHHGCVPTFADLYKNQVTIDAFYYHYPSYEQIQKYLAGCNVDDTWAAVDWLRTWLLPNFKNAEGGRPKIVECNTQHSGQCNYAFDFDEVHIDILLTFDDVAWAADNVSGTFSGTSANEGRVFSDRTMKQLVDDNFNETSLVFRVTVGGKNVLFTGDINYVGGYMLKKYHEANAKNSSQYYSLKTDYVQVSHHGAFGLPKNVYSLIDADVALWPVNSDEYSETHANFVSTRQWFADFGTTNYPAYQGPHVFSFPVLRSEGAENIPAELKDYVFDAEYYAAKYPDLVKLYGSNATMLYYHFLTYGIEEGRSASPFFDVKFYANQNGSALRDRFKGNYVAAFQDFLSKYKTNARLKLSENFDGAYYASQHSDLTTLFDLMKHYADNGYALGQRASTVHISADGKSYHSNCTVIQAVAPTCTTAGCTIGMKCSSCNLELAKAQTIPATGHNYVEFSNNNNGTHNAICACGAALREEHSYTYTADGAQHIGTCICGAVFAEKHRYTYTTTDTRNTGTCACGYTVVSPTTSSGAASREVANLGAVYLFQTGGNHLSTVQGMAIAGDYLYTAVEEKGARDAEGKRTSLFTKLIRMDLRTGEEKLLLTDYADDADKLGLGHANDMAAVCYGDYTYLFVTRYKRSVTWLKLDDEGVVQQSGILVWKGATEELQAEISADSMGTSGIAITSCKNGIAKILIANHNRFYEAEIDLETMSLHSKLELAFELDESLIGSAVESFFQKCGERYEDGSAGWGYQGFSYNRDSKRIFMPICTVETCSNGHEYRSVVLVMDDNGTILREESFAVNEYSLEMEEIDFYGSDLYWSSICYTPLENDYGITEGNRIYKIPMAYLETFADENQNLTWTTNGNRVSKMQIEEGALALYVVNSTSTNNPWIRKNLRISFTQADYMAIRFKPIGCDAPDPSAQVMRFSFSPDAVNWEVLDVPVTVVDGWYVAAASPTLAMKLMEVKYVQLMFRGIDGVDASSRILVDYVYVGPKSDAPENAQEYTVRFVNEDGSLLESVKVLHGLGATYSGETPAKAPDMENHYDFMGWDLPYDRITSDLTLTAQFAVAAHTVETVAGYAPTCSQPGLSDGTYCSVCGKTLAEQKEIPTTGHNYKVITIAPTCSMRGYNVYLCQCGDSYTADFVEALEHSYTEEITPASCTADGVKTFTCPGCNDSYTEIIPATGHRNTSTNTTDATCTEPGSVVVTCACGEVVSTEIVAALGHSYNAVTTAPTCQAAGYTTYTCTACGDSYQGDQVPSVGHDYKASFIIPTCTKEGLATIACENCGDVLYEGTVPPLGHSYEYVNMGSEHKVLCKYRCDEVGEHGENCENGCNYAVTEAHTYTEGLCICGALEVVEPSTDHGITFGTQLVLASDLTMTFRLKPEQLANYDLSTMYLVVERDIYATDGTTGVDTQILTEYTTGSRLIFSYSGIAAAQMNDEIRAVLHIQDKNGEEFVSEVFVTSVAGYLNTLLETSADNAKLVTLIMDMVNYGTAAQLYFKRHADAPVKEAYPSFQIYASYASVDFAAAPEDLSAVKPNQGATGALTMSLDLGTRVGIQYKLTLPQGVKVEDVTLAITDAAGNTLEMLDFLGDDVTVDNKGRYVVNFYGLAARQMRDVVIATAYAEGKAITASYSYSISTYTYAAANTAGMPANLVELTQMMLHYGDSAKAYFAK